MNVQEAQSVDEFASRYQTNSKDLIDRYCADDLDRELLAACAAREFTPEQVEHIMYVSAFTSWVMEGEVRKDKITPTIISLKEIAIGLIQAGCDATTAEFGLIHDTIEDTEKFDELGKPEKKVTAQVIEKLFGAAHAKATEAKEA